MMVLVLHSIVIATVFMAVALVQCAVSLLQAAVNHRASEPMPSERIISLPRRSLLGVIVFASACLCMATVSFADEPNNWTSFQAGGRCQLEMKLPITWSSEPESLAWSAELPGGEEVAVNQLWDASVETVGEPTTVSHVQYAAAAAQGHLLIRRGDRIYAIR